MYNLRIIIDNNKCEFIFNLFLYLQINVNLKFVQINRFSSDPNGVKKRKSVYKAINVVTRNLIPKQKSWIESDFRPYSMFKVLKATGNGTIAKQECEQISSSCALKNMQQIGNNFKGTTWRKTGKSHVLLLMHLNYPILFGTMSQSFMKIVPVVYEQCA